MLTLYLYKEDTEECDCSLRVIEQNALEDNIKDFKKYARVIACDPFHRTNIHYHFGQFEKTEQYYQNSTK